MVAPIDVRIVGDASGLSASLHQAGKDVSLFGDHVGITLPPKVAFATEAAKKLAEITVNTGKAAKDAAAEEQIFADAMSAVGFESDYQAQAVDDAISASQRIAFTDTETRKAILSLQTATKDTTATLDLLTVAQDIARVSGTSLESAADAVAKAAAGEDLTLKRMLPGLGETASAQDTITKAMELSAGAAETYGESSSAAGLKAKIAFGELQEEVGGALTPSLEKLGAELKPLIASLLEIAATVLPPVLDLLSAMVSVVARVAGVIGDAIDAIQRLMDKLRDLMHPLDSAITKLKEIDLNPFREAQEIIGGQAAGSVAGVSAYATEQYRAGRNQGGLTINIYGDPAVIEAKVTKALRDYTRHNGAGSIFAPGRS